MCTFSSKSESIMMLWHSFSWMKKKAHDQHKSSNYLRGVKQIPRVSENGVLAGSGTGSESNYLRFRGTLRSSLILPSEKLPYSIVKKLLPEQYLDPTLSPPLLAATLSSTRYIFGEGKDWSWIYASDYYRWHSLRLRICMGRTIDVYICRSCPCC